PTPPARPGTAGPLDPILVERVREALGRRPGVTGRQMFGGVAFMIRGTMCCGVVGRDLMVRVGPRYYEDALGRPGARPMDFTGRPLRGFVYVGGEWVAGERELAAWIDRGLRFAESLAAK
ncbi:MAG: TfoX/Sxy family protein, partial [Myxococcota bacterium]